MLIMSFFSNLSSVFAQNNTTFYAYSNDIYEFDDYAQQKVNLFMYSYYGYIDDSLELGKGVIIINDNGYQQVLYPVWKNNEIVAKFIVVKVGDELSGTFSTTLVEQLNSLIDLTSEKYPMLLLGKDCLYAKIGEQLYNLNNKNAKCDVEILGEVNLDIMDVVDISERMEYDKTSNMRSTTSKTLTWKVYSTQTDLSDGYVYNISK